MNPWEILDLVDLMERRDALREQTTSANVGAYPVPLGRPLRRKFPVASASDLYEVPKEYLELYGFSRSDAEK